MSEETLRLLELKLHDVVSAARLSVDAGERLGVHPADPRGSNAAMFAADLTERLAREAIELLEAVF